MDKTADLLKRNDISLSSLFEDVEEKVSEVLDHVFEGKIERMRRCLDEVHLLLYSEYQGELRIISYDVGREYCLS